MEQRGMKNPYFPAYHQPENNPPSLSPSYQISQYRSTPFISPPPSTIDDDLAFSFSRLHLPYDSPPPPPFGLVPGYLVSTSYWVPPSGPHREFLVGPGSGSGVDLAGRSYGNGSPSRLNFDDVSQRGSVYGQHGLSYGTLSRLNNFDDVGQRGSVCGQHGLSYGTLSRLNNFDDVGQRRSVCGQHGLSYETLSRLNNFDDVGQRGSVYGLCGNASRLNFDDVGQHGLCYGTTSRLNFDDVGQRGNNVDGQYGLCYGQNNYDTRISQNVESLYERKSLSEDFCVKDLKGIIVWFAQDQRWSKVLQTKIEEQSVEDNEFVVSEVVDFVCDLMKNQFGGYFIQKLFRVCNEDQRTRIILAATRMSFELVNVCLCSHGAKTVQILMENLNTPQQISLVISALCTGAAVLSSDPHGQHVIRCCLTNFSYEFNKLLLDKIVQNCIQIATNKSGCCVLQACVEFSHGEPRERLIDEIIANAIILAQDPYGNYVLQHLVGLGIPEVTTDLIQHLRGKFTTLSCNKFASNVVEKFILEAGEEYASTIIEDLLENSKAASMLLINPYGNFVIQSALSVSKGQVFEKLLDLILENAPSIRNNVYAEKIFAWFDKRNISLDKFINK